MSSPDIKAVCNLAWRMNTEVPEFYDQNLTEYCKASLFARLSTSNDYEEVYRYAFGNISPEGVSEVMARLDHGTRDTGAVIAGMVLTCVMLVVLGLRIFARLHLLSGRFKLEDWLVIAAAIWSCVLQGLNWALMEKGGNGKHLYDASEHEIVTHFKLTYFFELSYHLAILPVKLSFLVFYASLYSQTSRKFRYTCWGIGVLLIVGGVAFFLASMLRCIPLDAWNHPGDVWQICPNAYIRQQVYAVFSVTTDFILLALPLAVISKMKALSIGSRIGLAFLFSLGALVCTTTIVRIFTIRLYETDEDWMSYGNINIFLYVAEPVLAIIASSIPAIRALFLHVRSAYSSASNHLSGVTPWETSDANREKRRWSLKWKRNDVDVNELDVNEDNTLRRSARRSLLNRVKEEISHRTQISWLAKSLVEQPDNQIVEPDEPKTSTQAESAGTTADDITECTKPDAADLELGISPRSRGTLSERYHEQIHVPDSSTLSYKSSSFYSGVHGRVSGGYHEKDACLFYGAPPCPPPMVPLPDLPQRPLTPSTASSIACDYEIERQRSNDIAFSSYTTHSRSRSADGDSREHPNFRFSDPLPGCMDNEQERRRRNNQERSMSVPDSQAELRKIGSNSELKFQGLSPRPPPRAK